MKQSIVNATTVLVVQTPRLAAEKATEQEATELQDKSCAARAGYLPADRQAKGAR